MIESSIILLVLLTGGGLYLATRLAKEKDRRNPAEEKARLHASLAWHESRLQQAQAAKWDEHMIDGISAQVDEVRNRLMQIAAEERSRKPAA